MNIEFRKVTLELREYDALRLFALVMNKTYHSNRPWRPYWEYLARNLEESIGSADHVLFESNTDNESGDSDETGANG